MKIAFFSDCYLDLIGGIASSIDAQKLALEKRGHQVYIFTTAYPKSNQELQKLAHRNIFVVPSCKYFIRGITPISRRPKIIEKWLLDTHPEIKDFDVFYVHYEAGCSIAGLRLGKSLQIPTIQVMHGREDMGETNLIPRGLRTIVAMLLNKVHSWCIPHSVVVHRDDYCANSLAKAKMWTLMVNHANFADLVITPSAHFRKKLIHYGVTKKIKVVPNGYPDHEFPQNPTIKKLNPNEPLRIIWHSRVSAEKRMMPFLRALNILQKTNAQNNKSPNFKLDVYGGGGDFFRARRYARRHHLNIVFYGNVKYDKIQSAINNSHLDALVSYNFDTFGNTLIEAEAHGIPVFFCDPDMKEIVPKGSFILSRNESSSAMAEFLSNLLSHPEKIAEMSKIMLDHRGEVLISRRIKLLEKAFNDIIKK